VLLELVHMRDAPCWICGLEDSTDLIAVTVFAASCQMMSRLQQALSLGYTKMNWVQVLWLLLERQIQQRIGW